MVQGLVGIAANAADASTGIAKVEFRVDGSVIGTDTTAPYGWMWNATGVPQGTHVIEAKAFNGAGLTTTTSINVIVPAASVPVVAVTSPQAGSLVSGSVGLSANATDTGSGIAKVEFSVDGSVIGTDTTYPYGWMWNATGATPGAHTIQARAINRLGASTLSTVSVNVPVPAVTVPTVALTSPANGTVVAGSVGVSATADDTGSGIATVEFSVDGAAIGTDTTAPYGWMWNAVGAEAGAHTITAKATNRIGNSSSASISVIVPADTVPSVAINSPQNGAVVSGNVGLSATATDAGSAITKVEFRVDGNLIGTDTTLPYGWMWNAAGAPGAHAIEARAYNQAGKTGTHTITVTVPAAGGTSSAQTAAWADPLAPLAAEEEPELWVRTTMIGGASRASIPARTAIKLTGRLSADGQPVPARPLVTVWKSTAAGWTYEGPASWDETAGAYVFPAVPSSTSSYMVYFGGDVNYQAAGSPVISVKTYPRMLRPSVSSSNRFRAGGRLTFAGQWHYQKPTAVRIRLYRRVGTSWRYYGSTSATFRRTSSTAGTYVGSIRVRTRGYWRAIVIPDSGAPADALSAPRYFRVR